MPSASRPNVPLSAITGLIQPARIDALLARWVPDGEARAFVARCILEAGPVHHRGANYVLLLLLAEVIERAAIGSAAQPDAQTVPIPMRLPARHENVRADQAYPLRMSTEPLRRLAAGDERAVAAMIDCLTDGPPQHALANAAMVNALGLLLERLEARPK